MADILIVLGIPAIVLACASIKKLMPL